MRNILASALVFFFAAMVFLGNPVKSYAATCYCVPASNVNVAFCDDATYKPSYSGIGGAFNCLGAGPFTTCSCTEKKDCGQSGQSPCSFIDPTLKDVLRGALATNPGYLIALPLIEKVLSVDTSCKGALQSFSTSRGRVCATSQAEADALSTGAKWTSLKICEQMSDQPTKDECRACASQSGVWTAIGCIETSQEGIVSSLVKLGLGVGGGVVLLMILGASFKLSTSKGDPKATDEAKEMITNAIGGLLFIIFAMVLVRTIGIDILKIPGF